MKLRPYQQAIIDEARQHMLRGVRNVLIQAPTGCGKTVLAAFMVKTAVSRGVRCWFTVHRKELLEQTAATFSEVGIDYGIVSADGPLEPDRQVQLCSVQTLVRRLDKLPVPGLHIADEAHRIAGGQQSLVHAACKGAFHIGLTATPQRLDGKGLRDWYSAIVKGPAVGDLIADGHLAGYELYAPAQPDLAGIKRVAGDYSKEQLADAMDKPTITGCAIDQYEKRCPDARAIVFCVRVDHSKHTCEKFKERGHAAEHLDGSMGKRERAAVMARFRAGETKVLCNCDLFSEGLDIAGVEAAINLRPTWSLTLYLQQVGRALRPKPDGRKAIILDHAGNCYRHGLPDDPHQWTLSDRERRAPASKQEVSVRVCPECYYAQPPGKPVCINCGHAFAPTPREIAEREGELERVRRIDRKRAQGMARGLDELIAVGLERGYTRANAHRWASFVHASRQKRGKAVSFS